MWLSCDVTCSRHFDVWVFRYVMATWLSVSKHYHLGFTRPKEPVEPVLRVGPVASRKQTLQLA